MNSEIKGWYDSMSKMVQNVIDKYPSDRLYELKYSGEQCFIFSYDEPMDSTQEITLTMQRTSIRKTHIKKIGSFSVLAQDRVSDIKLTDIIFWQKSLVDIVVSEYKLGGMNYATA